MSAGGVWDDGRSFFDHWRLATRSSATSATGLEYCCLGAGYWGSGAYPHCSLPPPHHHHHAALLPPPVTRRRAVFDCIPVSDVGRPDARVWAVKVVWQRGAHDREDVRKFWERECLLPLSHQEAIRHMPEAAHIIRLEAAYRRTVDGLVRGTLAVAVGGRVAECRMRNETSRAAPAGPPPHAIPTPPPLSLFPWVRCRRRPQFSA
jgi:hypothetical protein